jgi:hypothetical protein
MHRCACRIGTKLSGETIHSRRQLPANIFVIVQGQGDLLEIVHALAAPSCLACRLHGRQEHCDQDSYDGNDHE